MERIAEPLRLMGAQIETTDGHLPLTVTGGALQAIDYELPVASAQVKSAVLLAGLGADGRTTVIEPVPTRDHTELMLRAAGARVSIRPNSVSVDPAERIDVDAVDVPGDFSSAAPFIVAATLVPGSRVDDPRRRPEPAPHGPARRARADGRARRHPLARAGSAREPVGDLEIRSAELTATTIRTEEVPLLVDELPLFGLLAARRARRLELGLRRRRAAPEGDRPDRGGRRRAPRDRRARPGAARTASRSPACRRGRAAAGSTRAATTGSRCWAPSPGSWSREGVRNRGRRQRAITFPGFYDLLDQIVQR